MRLGKSSFELSRGGRERGGGEVEGGEARLIYFEDKRRTRGLKLTLLHTRAGSWPRNGS
jgi:hypothetical protein